MTIDIDETIPYQITEYVCGTPGGYNRHRRHGEQPCTECRAARTKYDHDRHAAMTLVQRARRARRATQARRQQLRRRAGR